MIFLQEKNLEFYSFKRLNYPIYQAKILHLPLLVNICYFFRLFEMALERHPTIIFKLNNLPPRPYSLKC